MRLMPDFPEMLWLAAGDLNGDGRMDLAAVERRTRRAREMDKTVYHIDHILNLYDNPGGEFIHQPAISLDLPVAPSGLLIGDYDRDGKSDVAVGLRPRRELLIYPGAAGLTNAQVLHYGNDSGGASLAAGRISPGGADFMTGAAWRKWHDGARLDAGYFSGPEENDNLISTLADLNWDGWDDVIFTTRNHCVRIYYGPIMRMGILGVNDAFGVVTLKPPLHTNAPQPVLRQVITADVNGDGQLDLLAGAPGRTLVWLQNNPIGFTENAEPALVMEGLVALLAVDLSRQGHLDVVFRSEDARELTVWRQDQDAPLTSGGAASGAKYAMPRAINAVAAGDFNGDGAPELLAGLAGGGLAVMDLRRKAAPGE